MQGQRHRRVMERCELSTQHCDGSAMMTRLIRRGASFLSRMKTPPSHAGNVFVYVHANGDMAATLDVSVTLDLGFFIRVRERLSMRKGSEPGRLLLALRRVCSSNT